MAIANILDNIINGLEWDVELIIQGEPASKANSRRLVKKRVGNKVRTISIKSAKALAYEKQFTSQCLKLDPLIEDDVLLYCKVFYASRRPDLDESLIMDGLQGVIIKNDRQIKGKIIAHGVDREQAVIWRALQDCANEDPRIRLQAQVWMRGQTDYFHEICDMADFKPEYVMKAGKVLRDLGCVRGKKWLQRAKEKTK